MQRFRLRQLAWDLRENLLFRPAALAGAAALLGLALPAWEATAGAATTAALAKLLPMEPGSAQVLLGTLASALMTVVSVVYSILLVALSLASIQFSTRLLARFMRDRPAQNTLGVLLGAFVYALLVLRSVRTEPAWVPLGSVYLALALALAALGTLVWFIHHIVRSIQANHLVDAVAVETEAVLDEVFPERLDPGEEPQESPPQAIPEGAVAVPALRSGYIQLVAVDRLLDVAQGGHLVVARRMGQFVIEGAPLAWWRGPRPLDPARLDAAFDLGAVRTMQDDAEWGFRQIVDIGLKAISPAVNDPSTGATCVDHLARLLVRVAPRRAPRRAWRQGDAVVEVGTTSFVHLVRLGFEQLRQYGRADMAMTLRILRALQDVAAATPHRLGRQELLRQGRLAYDAARTAFPEGDREELERRWQRLQAFAA